MMMLFYDSRRRRYKLLNLIGPKNRLHKILKWLRGYHNLIPIEEPILHTGGMLYA